MALEMEQAWAWLLDGQSFAPFLCSKLGDVFFESDGGAVQWLNCSGGTISSAARDRAEFDRLCAERAPDIDNWFGPGLVECLHSAGKIAGAGQCYAFVIMPVFAECRYEPDNIHPVLAREVLVEMADIHRQLNALPQGCSVQVKIVD